MGTAVIIIFAIVFLLSALNDEYGRFVDKRSKRRREDAMLDARLRQIEEKLESKK